MTLLTASQIAAIRELGELGMSTPVTVQRHLTTEGYDEDEHPFGAEDDATEQFETPGIEVTGWLRSHMGREIDQDGDRVVGVHDFTLRVPVGTVIEPRDRAVINGVNYTVMESNTEDTWPEWTICYLKKVT